VFGRHQVVRDIPFSWSKLTRRLQSRAALLLCASIRRIPRHQPPKVRPLRRTKNTQSEMVSWFFGFLSVLRRVNPRICSRISLSAWSQSVKAGSCTLAEYISKARCRIRCSSIGFSRWLMPKECTHNSLTNIRAIPYFAQSGLV